MESLEKETVDSAEYRTCSHAENGRYEDKGVSMGRTRERAVCACDVVWGI
jgi:hypothetical protein